MSLKREHFPKWRWCCNSSVHQVVGHTRRALQWTQYTLLTAFFVASSIGWTSAVAVASVNTWATISEYKPQLQGPRSGLGAVASLQAASTATHPASAGSPSLLLGGRRVDLSPFSRSQYLLRPCCSLTSILRLQRSETVFLLIKFRGPALYCICLWALLHCSVRS